MDQGVHFIDDSVSAHSHQFQTSLVLSSYKHERTFVFHMQNILGILQRVTCGINYVKNVLPKHNIDASLQFAHPAMETICL